MSNWVSGTVQEEDAQFLKDLEEAKRRSLESFSEERGKWPGFNNAGPLLSPQPQGILPQNQSTVTSPQIAPPIGFITPQYTLTNNGNGGTSGFPVPFSGKSPGMQSETRRQSFPFGDARNFQSQVPMVNNAFTAYGFHPPNTFNQSTFGFTFPDTQRQSSPFSQRPIQEDQVDGEVVARRNTVSNPTGFTIKNQRNGNLYTSLSKEVRSLTEDLIDLGQFNDYSKKKDDGRNVLEAFDPLFEEKPQVVPELSRTSASPPPTQIMRRPSPGPDFPPAITEGPGPSTSNSSSYVGNQNYGWKTDISMSLYPSLPPPTSLDTLSMKSEAGESNTIYDAYNQFEYLYQVSISSESSSFYWHPNDASPYSTGAPPSPSRLSYGYVPSQCVRMSKAQKHSSDRSKRRCKLYEDITSLKKVAQNDGELIAFVEMLKRLKQAIRKSRSKHKHAYIKSSTAPSTCWQAGHSVKIMVWNENFTADSAAFTCEVSEFVGTVITRALEKMEVEDFQEAGANFILRVKGVDEYMDSDRKLIEYRYVQECIKFDEDVCFVLVHKSSLEKGTWSRANDDSVEPAIQVDDITPTYSSKVITYSEISKFLEVIEKESDKLNEKVSDGKISSGSSVNPTPLMQTVKGICVLLGEVQIVENRRHLQAFVKACEVWNAEVHKLNAVSTPPQSNRRSVKLIDEDSTHSYVEIVKEEKSPLEAQKLSVLRTKENVIESVRMLVEMYSKSFPVSFQMNSSLESDITVPGSEDVPKKMHEMLDPFIVRVGALHRAKSEWYSTYLDFYVAVEVFHGTRLMGQTTSPLASLTKMDEYLFFNTVIFDTWVDFEHLPICILPRECRLVFTIFGRKTGENGEVQPVTVELGWASIQCFDFQGFLIRGNQLLPLWPVGMPQKRLGPAPNSAFSYDVNVPLITIEFPDFGRVLKFPQIPFSNYVVRDFQSLDNSAQVQLKDIIEMATFTKCAAEDREVLWEKRHYLHNFPTALPKVLLSAQFWDYASLSELHKMLENWSALSPSEALQLLLPCFPDANVRQMGIKWVSEMSDEDLISVLPQLVEALSYETFDLSPLAEFLLTKSLFRFEIAHSLFWNLVSEVGLGKWGVETECPLQLFNSVPCPSDEQTDPRRRRLELMRNSLMTISYHKWRTALIAEFKLMQSLTDVTTLVKLANPSQRSGVLMHELKKMDIQLFGGRTMYSLPLSPAHIVNSLDVETSICYNSASVPLKINFKSALPEGGVVPVLFKQGDDIRQDMLTIQVIRTIESWWLKEGLDLRVVTFTCVPTGFKQGIIEIVPNAETLCKIQAEHGVTGAFRNRPIAEWLAKMNPSTLDYRRAVENFTLSCAAYCVLTYVLGICDRHNDNIMLTTKGHLFHIDFGKFLGDSQMFGSFKRDRAPFVLTPDMVYVINEGEKDSQRFQDFVERCCQAFRIVRKNGDILMNMFAMMATAGIPGVDIKSVAYVQNALLPDCSNVEAAAKFTRFIEESLTNWFTQMNFFIHSLAQLRFATDSTDNPGTLSFMPKMYSMDTEGRIDSAMILDYQKKYDPEKYYSYTVQVQRTDQNQPSHVHRSYKQFLELYQKLCINFPMAVRSLKSLPRSSGIGRSNVKQVAEKRASLLQGFLESLFKLADEISHSDLVYTFFHPLLKDEDCHDQGGRGDRSILSPIKIHGRVKICIQYSKGALLVLVVHAFDLACPNGQPPSAYVKSYLQPDPSRLTKRKTRVIKRSQNPTFMEKIEYRLPLEVILKRTLQLSVWHHDPLQENSFLGGVDIPLHTVPLDKETTETFTLCNLTVTS